MEKDCSTPETIALVALVLSGFALAISISIAVALAHQFPIVKFASDFLK